MCGLPLRDAFDSAFDKIIQLGYQTLGHRESIGAFDCMVAGHRVAAGPEVCLAPGRAGGHLPGDRDGDLRVLLAVSQVDRGGHLLKAEAPPAAIPEQTSGHHRGPLPVALPQVGDQELLGIGGQHPLGRQPVSIRQPPGQALGEPVRIAQRGARTLQRTNPRPDPRPAVPSPMRRSSRTTLPIPG